MKVLCDVHIALKICRFFQQKGCEAQHVNFILDRWNTKDPDLARYADYHDFVLVTKDVDFQNSHFLKRTPRKLLKISLGNLSTRDLLEILDANFDVLQQAFQADTCFIEIGHGFLKTHGQ